MEQRDYIPQPSEYNEENIYSSIPDYHSSCFARHYHSGCLFCLADGPAFGFAGVQRADLLPGPRVEENGY